MIVQCLKLRVIDQIISDVYIEKIGSGIKHTPAQNNIIGSIMVTLQQNCSQQFYKTTEKMQFSSQQVQDSWWSKNDIILIRRICYWSDDSWHIFWEGHNQFSQMINVLTHHNTHMIDKIIPGNPNKFSTLFL